MANRSNDILRYKKGEMTPAEMHALEREALQDPFLADALDGLDQFDASLLDKDIKSLEQKFAKKKKGTITTWSLRIAASFLIAALCFWVAKTWQDTANDEQLALENQQQPAPALGDTIKSTPLAENNITNTQKVDQADPKKVSGKKERVDEVSKRDETVDLTIEKSQPVAATSSEASSGTVTLTLSPDQVKTEAAPVVAPDVAKATADEAKTNKLSNATVEEEDHQARKTKIAGQIITGKVTSSEDGTPIPGVNVIVKGTVQGAITDINGEYQLQSQIEKPTLVFSFIGYQTQEVAASQNSMNIQLGVDATQLSEVVVVGYGYQKSTEPREPVIKLAEPMGGRKAYDNYLKTSLRYPPQALASKVKGRVTLQFTVKTDGSLDEFNVLKGLGFGCDEEVIRLVKEGPKWNPTTEDDVPIESEVRVKVRFSPPD